MEVPVGEGQQRFVEAIAAAERGEDVIFTRDGQAILRLDSVIGGRPFRFATPEEAAENKRRIGFAPDEDVWPPKFDDAAFSRSVLGLASSYCSIRISRCGL